MAFNLSGALANSTYAFDKIRKGINEEEDRDKKKEIDAITGEAASYLTRGSIPKNDPRNGAPVYDALPSYDDGAHIPQEAQGGIPTDGAPSRLKRVDDNPTTENWTEYRSKIADKIRDAGGSGDDITAAMDKITGQLRQKFLSGLNDAADALDAGDVKSAEVAFKLAYGFLPNNVALRAKQSKIGLMLGGLLESDELGEGGRGKAGSPTGNPTIIRASGQVRDMINKVMERPEIFGAMDMSAQKAQADLMASRAQTKGTKSATKAQDIANTWQDRLNTANIAYKNSLTKINNELAPLDRQLEWLKITNQHAKDLATINSSMGKASRWKATDISAMQKSLTEIRTLTDKQAAAAKAIIMKGLPSEVKRTILNVDEGVAGDAVEELSEEDRKVYDEARSKLDGLIDQAKQDADRNLLAQKFLGEFMTINPSPANGGLLSATYRDIVGGVYSLQQK